MTTATIPAPPPVHDRADQGKIMLALAGLVIAGLPAPVTAGFMDTPGTPFASVDLRFPENAVEPIADWVDYLTAHGCEVVQAGTGRAYIGGGRVTFEHKVTLDLWHGWRVTLHTTVDTPVAGDR